jgi:asparagine synthetase B (glutamine-hydrolysing)
MKSNQLHAQETISPNLASFLTLGYFLDYQSPSVQIDITTIDKDRYADASENELIDTGTALLKQAITESFELNRTHLVPISGGLDSRAILAGLLEHTDAHRIQTYTFGTPGTLDYDIGYEIAKKLGTTHTAFDLTQHVYTQDELEDISRRVDHQTLLFHHWPVWAVDQRFRGTVVWSGFLGEALTGSHRLKTPADSLTTAIRNFIVTNRYVKSVTLRPDGNDFTELLDRPVIDKNGLTLDEQLDLRNRQTKYIAPHVLMRKYEWCTPFLFQPWIDFILSIPDENRQGQRLYKKLLRHAFPTAFSHRTKSAGGLPLSAPKYQHIMLRGSRKLQRIFGRGSPQGTNYLDFAWALREKKDLRDLIISNIMDLKARNLIEAIDFSGLLRRHLNHQANHADALIVLASLELHLKAGMPFSRLR